LFSLDKHSFQELTSILSEKSNKSLKELYQLYQSLQKYLPTKELKAIFEEPIFQQQQEEEKINTTQPSISRLVFSWGPPL
jgi:hypothetical protein